MEVTICKKLTSQWFVPENNEGEEKQARFKIKPLTGAQAIECLTGKVDHNRI